MLAAIGICPSAATSSCCPKTASFVTEGDDGLSTALQPLSDIEFDAGMARLRETATREKGPVVDYLDLVVLH